MNPVNEHGIGLVSQPMSKRTKGIGNDIEEHLYKASGPRRKSTAVCYTFKDAVLRDGKKRKGITPGLLGAGTKHNDISCTHK
jgi:hypothetical protein